MTVARFEILLPPDRHRELHALADEIGMSASALARVGVNWVLAARSALLNGMVAGLGRDLSAFVDELRADQRTAASADGVADALCAMDIEGDVNPNAAALLGAIGALVRMPGTLHEKVSAIERLVGTDGKLVVSRADLATDGLSTVLTNGRV
jgi:hypothetical protein